MIKLGLTGSIATGKSTVADFMKENGAIIIDTDKIVHKLYKYSNESVSELIRTFGNDILENGSINRNKLAKIVFNSPEKLGKLNSIIHPFVRKEVSKLNTFYDNIEKKLDKELLCVHVIPLLYEAKLENTVDYVVVSYCSYENQLKRLMERNKFSREEAIKRIESQIPVSEKVKKADYKIDTNGSFESVKEQTEIIMKKLQWQPYFEK